MEDFQLKQALFQQQRLQILHLAVNYEEFNLDYAYAWSEGIYPITYDTDDSVLDRPHELYEDCFLLGKEMANKVFDYLCDKWHGDGFPVFDDLDKAFPSIDSMKLIKLCRFLYMNGTFDDAAWNKLLTPAQSPGFANSIKVEPSRSGLLDY